MKIAPCTVFKFAQVSGTWLITSLEFQLALGYFFLHIIGTKQVKTALMESNGIKPSYWEVKSKYETKNVHLYTIHTSNHNFLAEFIILQLW